METPKKKMRVDKRKNVEKVAIAKIKKPLSTQREIAKETGVSLGAVNSAAKEVEQIGTKDERIITLTDDDFDIVVLAQQRIKQKLQDDKVMEKTKISDISSVAKDSAARYTIFRGELTDAKGAYKEQKPLTMKQIEALETIELLLGGK